MPNTNTMNNHVPSLETCKRMKELGYPQKKVMFYIHFDNFANECFVAPIHQAIIGFGSDHKPLEKIIPNNYYAAPLASEILEQLPKWVRNEKLHYNLMIDYLGDGAGISYENQNKVIEVITKAEGKKYESCLHRIVSESITEACSLMWIFLKEKELI